MIVECIRVGRHALSALRGSPALYDLVALIGLVALTLALYRHLLLPDRALAKLNLALHTYPYREYIADRLSHGDIPLWNPYTFAGAPLLAEPSAGVLYPPNWLAMIVDATTTVAVLAVAHAILAGISMYVFARLSLGLSVVAALVAAFAYAFGGFAPSRLGDPGSAAAIAWTPLILLTFDRAFPRPSIGFLLIGTIGLTMQALSGGLYVGFITLLALFALALSHFVVRLRLAVQLATMYKGWERWRQMGRWQVANGWLVLAIVGGPALALGLAATQLLPTIELWQQSIYSDGRNYGGAMAGSLPPGLVLQALLPGFREHPSDHLIGYIGILPLALALLAVARYLNRRWTCPLLLFAGISIFMALGEHNPAMPWLFDQVWGLNRFEGPTSWLFIYTFAAAGLAGLGADVIVRGSLFRELAITRPRDRFLRLLPLLAFVFFILTMLATILILRDRLVMPKPEVWQVWIALSVIALDAIFLLPSLRSRLLTGVLILGLVVGELFLAAADLSGFATIDKDAFKLNPTLSQEIRSSSPKRVLGLVNVDLAKAEAGSSFASITEAEARQYTQAMLPDLNLEYRLPMVQGFDHDLLPLKNYQALDLLLMEQSERVDDKALVAGPFYSLLNGNISASQLSLLAGLNVGFVIDDRASDVNISGAYFDLTTETGVKPNDALLVDGFPIDQIGALGIATYLDQNAAALPNGSLVGTVTVVDEKGEENVFLLRAGSDTAVGRFSTGDIAHQPAPVLADDPRRPGSFLYVTVIKINPPVRIRELHIQNLLQDAPLYVSAISVLDGEANQTILLSPGLLRDELGAAKVYTLERTFPRAFLVDDYEVIPDEVAMAEALHSRIGQTAFFPIEPPLTTQQRADIASARRSFSDGNAEVLSYGPERIVVATSSSRPGLLMLTDAYYPGWEAKVDGTKVRILRADVMFRAVYVPAGEYTVEFVYHPRSFKIGAILSLASIGAVAAAVLTPLLWKRHRNLTSLAPLRRLRLRRQ